jgi:hypothetical protein
MMNAILKLVAITLGVLILTFFAVVFVRWMGYQQVFRAPPHPWFERSSWSLFNPSLDQLCGAENVDKLVPNGDWIIRLPIERRKDEWVVPCPEPKALAEYLRAQPHRDWLIAVRGHETWGLDELVENLRALEKEKQFAISADAQKILLYLRRKAPEWLFAADSSILLRFRVFESLWIETAMDFWPDFVITDFSRESTLDERGARELLRRQKRIIWDKRDGREVTPPQIAVQGFMTTRPE